MDRRNRFLYWTVFYIGGMIILTIKPQVFVEEAYPRILVASALK